MTDSRDISPKWYQRSFGALYPLVYAHRSPEAAAGEARFAAEAVGLGAGDRVLDLCCGAGRHSAHLLSRTRRVTGLDWSPELLAAARAGLGGAAALVRGDMRALPFGGVFDVVFNFFTSFGYFADDAENARAAGEMARVLRPGGRLFLDHIGAAWAAARLVPRSEREQDGLRIVEERWLDGGDPPARVNKVTTVWRGGARLGRFPESVRLYTPETLGAVLSGAGLAVERVFGDYRDLPPGPDAPRLIFVCRKGG